MVVEVGTFIFNRVATFIQFQTEFNLSNRSVKKAGLLEQAAVTDYKLPMKANLEMFGPNVAG